MLVWLSSKDRVGCVRGHCVLWGRAQETVLSGLSGGYGKALTKCGDLDTKTKEGKTEMEMEMMGREMTGVEQGGTSIVGRLCLHLTR